MISASVRNLSLVLHFQCKYEAAEETNRRVLAGLEKVLDEKHPHTLTSISSGDEEGTKQICRPRLGSRVGRCKPITVLCHNFNEKLVEPDSADDSGRPLLA
jgi:hypothetical protein